MARLATGKRTLPALIDEKALYTPNHTCLSIPLSSSCCEYRDVSYSQLARAVNTMSWWIHETLGTSESYETLCYLGPSDIEYFIFALASCKTGHKTLFTSPRNNAAAHLNLIRKTSCTKLVGPQQRMFSDLQKSAEAKDLEYTNIPALDHWLDEKNERQVYKSDMSYETLADKPFMILHSSGSTGMPKPIEISHSFVSAVDNWRELPSVDGRVITLQRFRTLRVFCCLPPFHSAGQNLWWASIFFGYTLVLPPATSPPDFDVVRSILDTSYAQAGVMAPSILEQISNSEEDIIKLESWSFVMFGGGPLSRSAGDRIWKYTKVYSLFGSTETKCWPELEPLEVDEWPYHNFHPQLGLETKENTAETYELVFKRKPELTRYHPVWHAFPDKQEFSSMDVFSRHETKENLWLHRGRADDMIVMSNGEKFNPQDLELRLASHPDIKASLVVGNAREQLSVLIEPAPSLLSIKSPDRVPRMMEVIGPLNEHLPGHAKIDEEHIHVFRDSDTFPRSSKGAVQRQPALQKLENVVKSLYDGINTSVTSQGWSLSLKSQQALERSLLDILRNELKLADLNTNDNLFDHGIDSLKVSQISRKLTSSLSDTPLPNARRLIYQNPTVHELSEQIMGLSRQGSSGSDDDDSELHAMQAAIDEYQYRPAQASQKREKTTEPQADEQFVETLPQSPASPESAPSTLPSTHNSSNSSSMESMSSAASLELDRSEKVVLLYGSTGRLGSYILHSLLVDKSVRKIYCINRSAEAEERQLKTAKASGLSTEFERCVFVTADLTKPNFAFSDSDLQALSRATHVIHNAWNVDFNMPFQSFIPNIKSCQILISLAAESKAKLLFVSSVGAANYYKEAEVPETLVDLSSAEPMGYARSKVVAEHIFASSPIPTTIVRVGQIAGPLQHEEGLWNPKEWFPSLMISSTNMGMVPDLGAMEQVDWLPSDDLGDILVEMLFSDTTGVLHAVNPKPRPWTEIWTETGGQLVCLKDWITELKTKDDLEKCPALKLIDFYEDLSGSSRPLFITEKGRKASRKLATQGHIRGADVEKWAKQWV